MSWSGLAWYVSCDTFPSFCSSHRTSITLTTPKQTYWQPNLPHMLTGILKTICVIRLHTWKSILGSSQLVCFKSNFVNIAVTSPKAKFLQIFCDGNDPVHFNMRHKYPRSEDSQRATEGESTSSWQMTSWNHRKDFSIIKASWPKWHITVHILLEQTSQSFHWVNNIHI